MTAPTQDIATLIAEVEKARAGATPGEWGCGRGAAIQADEWECSSCGAIYRRAETGELLPPHPQRPR